MNLIMIIGAGAVGKMTVGQELMKITDYRLFHNHHMIEPVIDIFGRFDGATVNELRELIFDNFIKSNNVGMIFTYMWAFDMQSDWDYVKHVTDKFEASGGSVYYVELVADQKVRIERNKTENRLRNKASKRDIVTSEDRMLREETRYRIVSRNNEIPFENYIKIDNTNLEPAEVAHMIKEHFNLPDKTDTELMQRVKLEEVKPHEIQILHEMQVESFMPLYRKYHDDISPALESLEHLTAKCSWSDRKFYFINKDGARVGAINIGTRAAENDDTVFFVSPIFVLPKYQNLGIGRVAMKKAFEMHPEATKWKLTTIAEEDRTCHLYEKCGFVRIGEPVPQNDVMTLVDYEKICKRSEH